MNSKNFVRKPYLLGAVLIFIAMAIFYIESQKPHAPDVKTNKSGSEYPRAPDFAGIDKWINSEPLNMEQLRGKVVLVDFWTYTCINCIRTLPYLKEWDKKYGDQGLVIVGIHTPEFEFEKKYENVLNAVNKYNLKYPVAQDNNYVTWNLYQNRYWPHKYLIDMDGYIRYDHIGEGAYEETEKMIQKLLQERMEKLNKRESINTSTSKPIEALNVSHQNVGTPEIYFGYQFDRGNLGYQGLRPNDIGEFSYIQRPVRNTVYLKGIWKYNADNMELVGDKGSILLIYNAKDVNIVAGSEGNTTIFVYKDANPLKEKDKGSDIEISVGKSLANIDEFKLYNLVSGDDYGEHIIEINALGKGFKIYTFTFG